MIEAIEGIEAGGAVYQNVYGGTQSKRTIVYTFPKPYDSTPNYMVSAHLTPTSGSGAAYHLYAFRGRINGSENSFSYGSGQLTVTANSSSMTIDYATSRVLTGSLVAFACF